MRVSRDGQGKSASNANLVEIDSFILAFPLERQTARRTAYMPCVRRAARPGKAEVYSMLV
ncbi:MAG TPA: hypothetical protein VFE62_23930 [Gemmataceae bacterium]|nr:hypothetical protein [Gemmataceae bacterium]